MPSLLSEIQNWINNTLHISKQRYHDPSNAIPGTAKQVLYISKISNF